MSTLEALNAISEAIQAHAKLPEVEIKLKEMTEIADFRQLELDEANFTIDKLRQTIIELQNWNASQKQTIEQQQRDIIELRDRNNMLDESLRETVETNQNLERIIVERNLQIDSLRLTVDSLSERLAESKSVTARLTDTLKSIGASIVSAVAEPEVSNPSTFHNSVAMPDPASIELDSANNPEPVSAVAEPSRQDLVSADAVGPSNVADGCFPYRYW